MMMTLTRAPKPERKNSIVKSLMLSHGTMECRDLNLARKFYEEFLGLEVAQIGPQGLAVGLGPKFHIVCLQTGEEAQGSLTLLNHWGVEVATAQEVRDVHKKAHELKDVYELRNITPIESVGGRYSFFMVDRDGNWWEIQYYKGLMHDDFFEFGDVPEEFS